MYYGDKEYLGEKSLDLYLAEINNTPLLTREEEKQLARRIKKGDEEAFHKMIKANLRFVVSIAKNYINQGLSLADLINEGNVGLIKAAHRFDEKRGFKFISYAVWWIRQAMLQALAEQSRIVRLPLNRAGTLYRIGKISRQLDQELGREPEVDEIADKLGVSVSEVRDTMKIANSHLSLDASYNNDPEENSLGDYLVDDDQESADEMTYTNSLSGDMRRTLDTLTEREKNILIMYFGLNGEEPLTLEEIGRKMDLTRERIRQIKEKAIKRLRHVTRSKYLKDYIED
ncbi:MAG: sigma-70 family RNA polymerase sigma factor [Candidatus Latescibacteria bacterium]|jgi:RNA polymerase primary sigma factor|nr:sigma-70 family RNA polymerase sigma factor [bacterium]MBD3424129.1 sigma-70 family RNA polymerase sigma factor [Candidatus Latescibacterota bacterium]